MAVGDVYEVVDVQTLQDQEIQNVYFYRQVNAFVPLAGSMAQAIADEFVETLVPVIASVQAPDLIHTEVRVRNLFNGVDAATAVAGVIGGWVSGSDFLPSFAAWGLRMTTANASVRDGAKRIAGIPEIAQTDGVPIPEAIDGLNLVADALAEPITGGLIIEDDILFPVIVKRVRTGVSPDYEYRLPENTGELVFGTVLETLVKLFITSQISRKFGVGI